MSHTIAKDEDYYLRFSIFLVEDTLFKVPTYLLESQSSVFSTMFTLPPLNGEFEGQTDDQPIRLEGIKKDDFRALLKVLYPKQHAMPLNISEEDWISVLGLSTQWAMNRLRLMAIQNLYQHLRTLPLRLITLGKQHDISDWIFTGVEILLRREKPLGEEDAMALGMAEVLNLASIRECLPTLRSPADALNRGRGPVPRSQDIDTKIQKSYEIRSVPSLGNRAQYNYLLLAKLGQFAFSQNQMSDDELREITGIKPIVWLEEGEEREVGSQSNQPGRVMRTRNQYHCTCPAWLSQDGNVDNARSCKHLKTLLGEEYENARIKLKNPDGPPPRKATKAGSNLKPRKKGAFGLLLKVIYKRQLGIMPVLSEEEWLSVLDLSTAWNIARVRALAMENLCNLPRNSPHELIALGKQYDINDWILSGVDILVRREKPLSREDVTALGIADVLKIASIRESVTLRSQRDPLSGLGRGCIPRSQAIDAKIQELYGVH